MKITKNKLRQIIQEEMESVMSEAAPYPLEQAKIEMLARDFLKLTTSDGSQHLSSQASFEDFKNNPQKDPSGDGNDLYSIYNRAKTVISKDYDPRLAGMLMLSLDKDGGILQKEAGHSGRARALSNILKNGFDAKNNVIIRTSGDLNNIPEIKGQFDRSVTVKVPKEQLSKSKDIDSLYDNFIKQSDNLPVDYPVKFRPTQSNKYGFIIDPASGIAGALGQLTTLLRPYLQWYIEKNKEKLDVQILSPTTSTIGGSELVNSWKEFVNFINDKFVIKDQDGIEYKVFPPAGMVMILRASSDDVPKRSNQIEIEILEKHQKEPNKEFKFTLNKRG